ncbi:MAG: CDP-alcohol phosphatidyltransferase family protein [Rhodospirillales bacterium]|nr:CDP-alcohol phosphatidyltransferase family protein [Rhodospirillales bacterium]
MSALSSSDAAYTLRAPKQLFPLTRHLSYRLTPLLLRLPLTPNHVTGLSAAAGLAGAACFLRGTWGWGVIGGLLLILCYTLDNCDGEVARIKNMSSEWGARLDDIADWLVDTSFFACLGIGAWSATGEALWLWFGIAAAAGATVDFGVDLVHYARNRKKAKAPSREEVAKSERKPEDTIDWLIYIFHKLSRADFCVIVCALALFDVTWVLLPLGAVGAQAFWITDLFNRARGWHT